VTREELAEVFHSFDFEKTGVITEEHARLAIRQSGLEITSEVERHIKELRKETWDGE